VSTIFTIDNHLSPSLAFCRPFSCLLLQRFISLHHRMSHVACQPLVSFGSVCQSSSPTSGFYFQIQVFIIFHLEFDGDVRIYPKSIYVSLYKLIYIYLYKSTYSTITKDLCIVNNQVIEHNVTLRANL